MKIGITERGDAALDFSWLKACLDRKVDGCIIVTKDLKETVRRAVLNLHYLDFPIIVHATCTGFGGTVIEPNVPKATVQMQNIKELLNEGFPAENIVIRIDPIFPTKKGLIRAKAVIQTAYDLGLFPQLRCRISILDEYKHVKERFRSIGLPSVYPDGQFTASKEEFALVEEALSGFYGIQYETCAEPYFTNNKFVALGCVSQRDLEIMGFDATEISGVNPQNRCGCLCLNCKKELLQNKNQCKHGCVYCYWRNTN